MKRTGWLLAFLLMGLNGLTQITINGNVKDAQLDQELAGASIYWKSDWSKGTYTDEQGAFELSTPLSSDTLCVSYVGYREQQIGLESTDTSLEVKLVPFNAEVKEIVVKAQRLASDEFAIKAMNQLDVYLNPNAKADVLLAVNSLPSSTSVDETANISLRGSPAQETGIYLNNVPVRDAVRLDQPNGVGQFSVFNTSMIESVKVFPSNPPLEFGGATAGAVALYTIEKLGLNRSSWYLSLVGSGIYLDRPVGDRHQLTGFINQNIHYGLKGLNAKALKDIESFNTTDVGINWIYKIGKKSLLKLFNLSLMEGYEYHFSHPSWSGIFDQQKRRNLTIANFSIQGDAFRFEWNQGINVSNAKYATGNLDNQIKSFDLFNGWNLHIFKNKWSAKTGISVEHRRGRLFGTSPVFNYALGPTHPSFELDDEQKIWLPEWFLFWKYRLTDQLSVGIGNRIQPGFGDLESYWSKQLSLHFSKNKFHQFKVSVGTYHQYALPNQEVNDIHLIQNRQGTLDYQFRKEGLTLQSALYHKKTKRGSIENLIYGFELFGELQAGNFKGSISFAHIHSEIMQEEVVYPSPHDLDYFIRIMSQYSIPGWFDVSIAYLQRQGTYWLPVIDAQYNPGIGLFQPIYSNITEGERIPMYRLLDISFSRPIDFWKGSLIVFLSANNVFDFKNVRSFEYTPDYSDRNELHYNRRAIFFGGVYSW